MRRDLAVLCRKALTIHYPRERQDDLWLPQNQDNDSKGKFSAGSARLVTPFGVGDGARETIMFGVKEKKYLYTTALKNNRQAIFQASKAMSDIGRALILETAPDAAVCYVKSYVFRPVVLIFEEREDDKGDLRLVLSAYCGRSPIAIIPIARAVSRFNKQLTDDISRIQ